MIYLVTSHIEMFDNDKYEIISKEKSLEMVNTWKVIQCDSETDGKDCHINNLLCFQMGNRDANTQIVIDCSCIDIRYYKEVLESKPLLFHNAKFDLQFLYNYNIIPRKIYDTMIVEQFLHLGFPSGLTLIPEEYNKRNCTYPYLTHTDKKGKVTYKLSYSLKAIANNRLNIDIDKTTRGEIIWRGLDTKTILYAAGDVMYLEDIMNSQLKDLSKIPNSFIGSKIECYFTPVVAYLEWCGIKLDVERWKNKMEKDRKNLADSIKELNDFVLRTSILKEPFTSVNLQGDLFEGFNLNPKVNINWASPSQVVKVAKLLGFNVKSVDKETGEDKESVMEKQLRSQKGINDEFLKLYFGNGEEGNENYFPGYSGSAKVVSSFGQSHLDAINPKTGRIHTTYRSIGTISGRMSSGSREANTDLAKYKKLPASCCTYPNMQQLPHDAETRRCFIAEEGNLFCSCDYSAKLN